MMTAEQRRASTDTMVQAPPASAAAVPASRAGAAALSVSELRKEFVGSHGKIVRAIDNISLEIQAGEMLVLLGPSGCGKTTLLRCVAGLERPNSGRISIGTKLVYAGQPRVEVPTQRRALSMMFQSYALWPHMTAFDNVAYPLRARSVPARELNDRVTSILEIAGVGHLLREFPSRMSGGQQQRVALARALVAESPLILFDEPLSNVDAKVREQLRREISLMQDRFHFAGLYVTHDQKEALALADRIAAIEAGRVVQIGTPEELYNEPTSAYVANLLGSVNHLRGVVKERQADTVIVETEAGLARGRASLGTPNIAAGDKVTVLFRPEHARLADQRDAPAGPDDNEWSGRWESHIFAGSHAEEFVRIGDKVLLCAWNVPRAPTPGREVSIRVPRTAVRVIADPASERAATASGGIEG